MKLIMEKITKNRTTERVRTLTEIMIRADITAKMVRTDDHLDDFTRSKSGSALSLILVQKYDTYVKNGDSDS